MQPIRNTEETQYEKNQRFNSLVSWFHSFRYSNILSVFAGLARRNGGRKIKVVEIGCSHAKLYSLLNGRFEIDYTGIELNPLYVKAACSRYSHNSNFRVVNDSVVKVLSHMKDADVVVALETFEHIPEHDVVRIVETIASFQPKLFVCSVPVEIGPAVWLKNLGSFITGYMRHKEYSWIETFWAGLYQLDKLPPHGTKHKGFDWRWLAQTIRHNMRVIEIRKFPLGFLPAAFASSVFIITEPRK